MVFNFARKRKNTDRRPRAERSPELPARSTATEEKADGTQRDVKECESRPNMDAAGIPVAFGPVFSPLSDMEVGGRGVLREFDMPEQVAEQLMNLGFVPGLEVLVAQSGPGGDPRVYRVDGTEVALRGELAKLIAVAPAVEAESERISAKKRTAIGANGPEQVAVGLSTQEASAD